MLVNRFKNMNQTYLIPLKTVDAITTKKNSVTRFLAPVIHESNPSEPIIHILKFYQNGFNFSVIFVLKI